MDKMAVDDYGWDTIEGPHSCFYITRRILSLLKKLEVRRVLDLGSGNGTLCSQPADQGYLIITTPYHGYLKNLVISLLNKWDFHFTALRRGGHNKFFSRRTITRLLTDNGFNVVGFSGVGGSPTCGRAGL
jgi:hypothetical protein